MKNKAEFLPQFCARAIIQFRKDAKLAKKINPMLHGTFCMVASLLEMAEKFVLPVNAEIYRINGGDAKLPTPEELQSTAIMPAPVCAFEYAWDRIPESEIELGLEAAKKRITLIISRSAFYAQAYSELGLPPPPEVVESLNDNVGVILSMFYSEGMGGWVLAGLFVSANLPFDMRPHDPPGLIHNFYQMHAVVTDYSHKVASEKDTQLAMAEYFPDFTAIIQVCHALRAGAKVATHTEKSSNRRTMFKAKGVGGFEYHTLVLPGMNASSGVPSISANHAAGWSPRHHFRRAHIRKLPTGVLTFVRHCFVGDKENGEVMKRYSVEKVHG